MTQRAICPNVHQAWLADRYSNYTDRPIRLFRVLGWLARPDEWLGHMARWVTTELCPSVYGTCSIQIMQSVVRSQ